MADDRPMETEVEAIARLSAEVADMRTTLMARSVRSPTGTIEMSMLAAPKADTLFMQGQTLNRADYPVLWQWVVDNSRVAPGLFGAGDGSTTFVMPDWKGRVVRGATGSPGVLTGSDSVTLSVAQMPAHKHSVSSVHSAKHTHGFTTDSDGNHGHSFTTDGAGTHAGHFPANATYVASGSVYGVAAWNSPSSWVANHSHSGGTTNVAAHNHGGTTGDDGTYSHTMTESTMGSGGTIDSRQAGVDINYAIYT